MSTESCVSRLESTLTNLASVSSLSSTLTGPSRKSIKTRDFNSIRCHTYEGSLCKPCRINTYKKQGVGEGVAFTAALGVREWLPGEGKRGQINVSAAKNDSDSRNVTGFLPRQPQ